MKMIQATGRRKNSVAQVRLVPGSGKIKVNNRTFDDYFPIKQNQLLVLRPLDVTETSGQFDIYLNIHGGGQTGQTGAAQLAIARALIIFDEEMKTRLKPTGMLTRDPRMVERKKYGQKKARKRFQFSKR